MDHLLLVHRYLAYFVAAVAILFVWWRPGRRAMLYLLSLQIALGVAVILGGINAPWQHPALAVVAWIGYMAANIVDRRRGEGAARIVAGICSVLVLGGYYVGMHAARAMGLPR